MFLCVYFLNLLCHPIFGIVWISKSKFKECQLRSGDDLNVHVIVELTSPNHQYKSTCEGHVKNQVFLVLKQDCHINNCNTLLIFKLVLG